MEIQGKLWWSSLGLNKLKWKKGKHLDKPSKIILIFLIKKLVFDDISGLNGCCYV